MDEESELLVKTCRACQHVVREGSENPNVWMCDIFPDNRPDFRAGGVRRPYQAVSAVLRISQPNDTLPCVLFEPLPEHGEPVISEARGVKSVKFKEKETA